MRLIGRLHLVWILIVILAAYVIFAMFVADVGGNQDAISHPISTLAPTR